MNYDNLKIPKHVGMIIDGNGRWATSRGLNRSQGHKAGLDNLKQLIDYIFSKGIDFMSIFVFSTENFKRSREEVNYLMDLFVTFFTKEFKKYEKENVKVVFSGRREPLREDVLKTMDKMREKTKNNTGKILNICINYGGHAEIVDTAKTLAKLVQEQKLSIEQIDEQIFEQYLYETLPPIDLLIRTSGEYRLSNFMLWQASYAEFYFPNIHFPDFKEKDFDEAILNYTKRDRRFGGINYEN